jgi:hypothetical protein
VSRTRLDATDETWVRQEVEMIPPVSESDRRRMQIERVWWTIIGIAAVIMIGATVYIGYIGAWLL